MAKGLLIGLAMSTVLWIAIGAGVYAVLKPSADIHFASHARSAG